MSKKYKFHITGIHLSSCKILIEDILREQDFIKKARVDLKKKTVEIEIINDQEAEEIAIFLTDKIKSHGYALSVEKIAEENENDNTIWKAIPIGLVFLTLFFFLQKSGLLNLGLGGKTTPVTSFIIGLIASVSSCL